MNTITLTDGARQIVFPAVTDHGWYFFNLRGWHGQTSDKIRTEERPQAHGAFASSRSLRSSRGISFEVAYRDGTTTEVEEAVAELSSFGAESPILMTVEDDLGTTRRTVKVDSIPDRDDNRLYTGDMMVGLVAEDSRRYGITPSAASTGPAQPGQGLVFPEVWPLVWPAGGSSGRITLTNTGKAPSAPTFVLRGGFDTAMITCIETGARLGLSRQVPVDSSVVIDTESRTAIIDGQSSVSRWIQFREWETIPPGVSRTYQLDATGIVSIPGYIEEVARNLSTNPNAVAAVGFISNGGTNWTVTRNAAAPAGHPQGITTAARCVPLGSGTPGSFAMQMYNADALGNTSVARTIGAWFWIDKPGYSAGISSGTAITTPLEANAWTFVLGSVAANTFAVAVVGKTDGSAGDTSAVSYVTGSTALPGGTAPARTIAGGVPYLESELAAEWLGAANGSQSALIRTVPTRPTASFEGKVYPAWW